MSFYAGDNGNEYFKFSSYSGATPTTLLDLKRGTSTLYTDLNVTGSVTAPTFIGNLSGNASTATKLQTVRTLWGQPFDGTGNVFGDLANVSNITASGNIKLNYSSLIPKAIEFNADYNGTNWGARIVADYYGTRYHPSVYHGMSFISGRNYFDNFRWFKADFSEIMTLFKTGNLVLGKGTNPTDDGYKLDVFGPSRFTGNVVLSDTLNVTLSKEVGGQLANFGVNYAQAGGRNASVDGGFFRIDTRPEQNLFDVIYQKGGVPGEIILMGVSKGGNLYVSGTGRFTGEVTAPTFIGALSGNASSATKLQTARTIAGVSFDGTANIAIPFANLSSKPTTLAGYGITDAASLNHTHAYLPLSGGSLTSTMKNVTTGVFGSPHLALKASNTLDNNGFVGMTFATSTSPNYGYSLGALRSTNGGGDLVIRRHNNDIIGTEVARLSSIGELQLSGHTVYHTGNFNPSNKVDVSTYNLDMGNIAALLDDINGTII
jgi:hypothetical protein